MEARRGEGRRKERARAPAWAPICRQKHTPYPNENSAIISTFSGLKIQRRKRGDRWSTRSKRGQLVVAACFLGSEKQELNELLGVPGVSQDCPRAHHPASIMAQPHRSGQQTRPSPPTTHTTHITHTMACCHRSVEPTRPPSITHHPPTSHRGPSSATDLATLQAATDKPIREPGVHQWVQQGPPSSIHHGPLSPI